MITIAMISISDRQHVMKNTIKRLNDLSLYCNIFYSNLSLGIENHTDNTKCALLYLLNNGGGIFMEDDLCFSDKFPIAINEVIKSKLSPVCFYVPGKKFLSSSVKHGNIGIIPLINIKHYFGSQCIYILPETIKYLLNNWIDGKFFDTQLQVLHNIYGYFPNPVQHYGENLKSTWSPHGKPHRSITYE